MAKYDYAGAEKRARKQIDRYGSKYEGIRPAYVYRDGSGKEIKVPQGTVSVVGLPVDFGFAEYQNLGVSVGDVKFICYSDDVLKVGDRFTLLGKTFRIKDPRPVAPGGSTIVYRCHMTGV
uniref:Head closure Hc1 n=1 Tax=Pectobacterium phage Taid TaxID=3158139 RepID=A0AB39AC21_9CAUD